MDQRPDAIPDQIMDRSELIDGLIVSSVHNGKVSQVKYVVVGEPFKDDRDMFKIKLRNKDGGAEHEDFLVDIGIDPYESCKWNLVNQTVKVN